MSVVVTSCGRSGINMALEILTGNSFISPTEEPEDKQVFSRNKVYPDNFLTECDTIYYNEGQLRKTMIKNPNMKLIWMVRDPRDMIMSKFRRGVPREQGGDCKGTASDATPKGAVEDIQKMVDLYKFAIKKFNSRVIIIKMEHALLHTEGIAKSMCNFIGIDYEESMIRFWERMRVIPKKARYKNKDLSQIAMHKNWRTAYSGWLVDKKFDMESIFDSVKPLIEYFGYEE